MRVILLGGRGGRVGPVRGTYIRQSRLPWGQTGGVRLNTRLRSRRTAELEQWARSQPVLYSTSVFVRSRKPGNTWVSWHHRPGGGAQLTIRRESVEVSAPQGMLLETRTIVFPASTATMKRDRVGWAGTPFGRKNCIRIHLPQRRRWIEIALTPEKAIEEVWRALSEAGVQVKSSDQ